MQPDEEPEGRSLVRNRTMEIVMALFLLAVSAIVIKDTLRLGIGWTEGSGPASGYFPFYVACALAVGSLVTLYQAIMGKTDDADESFVSVPAMGRILTVLIPSTIFVGLISTLGIYIASLFFIMLFMIFVGREPVSRSVLVALFVTIMLYMMFEKWFLVTLPKSAPELWASAPLALQDGLELYLDRLISPYFEPIYRAFKFIGNALFATAKP